MHQARLPDAFCVDLLKAKILNSTGNIRFVSRRNEREFTAPLEIVSAASLREVIPCLERVEGGVARGFYAAGFIAYEAAPAFDPALQAQNPGALPLLWFGLYRTMELRNAGHAQPGEAFEVGPWTPLVPADVYRQNIRRIRELIAAGDTYQVNYTFPLRASFRGNARSWFHALCAAQQADYCADIDLGRVRLLSASPELFFRLRGNALETRPMKGTRPRGRWSAEDRELARALAESAKDRAENIMIVDLLRNDMARISEAGSVRVHSVYDVESYPTVWQMTSSIRSHTRASIPDIFRALFPSGSVTGAPKIRTMEIIRDLEPHPRGVYCGTIGWWAPDGEAEFNVAIRTVTIDSQSGQADYHVGSGITYGSSAEDEYEECQLKASLLTRKNPEFELIETLRYDGGWFLFAEHMERLAASAGYFGFVCDRPAIEEALRAGGGASSTIVPLKIRLLLRRDGSFTIQKEPLAPPTTLKVGFATHPVDAKDVFLYHKTTCRAVYRQALASRPDCDDVLLWNARDEITESTIANVVLDLDGARWTPPPASGLLEGAFRRQLLAQRAIAERVLTRQDVLRASGIHLINSVRQWIDIQWIDR
jgi:para-aminobenzoate synthetase/4-amino-4-deoxychorismate lyase